MLIHGEYINGIGQHVAVRIVTGGDTSDEIEIGVDGVHFSDSPVQITSEVNDTFDVLLTKSATVNLQTDRHIPELYTSLCRNSAVNISVDGVVVFAGFVEPLSYSQPFVSVADDLEVNCIDCLSALQYSNFKDIGAPGVDYDTVKANAGRATFWNILREIVETVAVDSNVSEELIHIYYDGSKAINASNANKFNIFTKVSISELLFLGDDEDDVSTQEEVLTEVLKYFNLHIEQRGLDFYIFDWATIKGTGSVTWRDLIGGTSVTETRTTTALSLQNVASDDASVEIGEVYNRIEVEDEIEKIDNLVDGILDEDLMTSPYTYNQLYLSHVFYDTKKNSLRFRQLCQATYNRAMDQFDEPTDGKATVYDYYVRIMKHKHWIFPMAGDESVDLVDHFCGENTLQDTILDYVGSHIGACLLKLGTATYTPDPKDNSPVSKVSWETILYVGKPFGEHRDNNNELAPDAIADATLLANAPVAVYHGDKFGASVTPVDDNTVNYIVFTGKLAFVDGERMPWDNAWNIAYNDDDEISYNTISTLRKDKEGNDAWSAWGRWRRMYNQQGGYWYTGPVPWTPPAITTSDWQEAVKDRVTDPSYFVMGMTPLDTKFETRYEYKYSGVKDSTDKLSKLDVLACMLRIGDKVAVEHDVIDGQDYYYTWETYKTMEECSSEDEYWSQCIFLGIDPKIGDKLFNTEYSMANNISVAMKLDMEGMAIPIHKTDNVSGDLDFKILGMVNLTWDTYTKRHKTWFRKERWSTSSVDLLPRVKAVIVKKLDIKLVSDNGQFDPIEDQDLIYMSDTDETFVNKKDDISFKITTDLTSEEAAAIGVRNYVKLSAPYKEDEPLTQIYDRTKDVTAKPEQLYVDSYYNEWHAPRLLLEQEMQDRGGRLDSYTHPALSGKTFFVQGESLDLGTGYTTLKLKEIEND